jgi:predicted enzyme related to lactoylglutathione lyase
MNFVKLACAPALLLTAIALAARSPALLVAQDAPVRTPQTQRDLAVHYLEIVSSDVRATCAALEKLHGIAFSQPDAGLGNARTAKLEGGGRIGVRAPMRADEEPVVRPYLLVEDIEAAIRSAEGAGALFAIKTTEIPGQGKFAIYFLGGTQYGLWQR